MSTPDAAQRHYLTQQALTTRTVTAARRVWSTVDIADLDGSWRAGVADQMFVTVSVSQLAAARAADPYVAAVLTEQRISVSPDGRVDPWAFAGIASDGRDLDSLLYEPVIATKTAIGAGANPVDALRAGEVSLTRIVATQIQDAGRVPVGVGITTRPRVGWVRMLNPPSCSRCVVLAGAFYRWNDGFERHPACDCRHIPTGEKGAGDLTTNPDDYFASLSAEDQDRTFGQSGAQAIRDGADIGQVVNARRGVNAAGFTTEGTTVRGFAGRRAMADGAPVRRVPGARYRSTIARPMPETIYQQAATREEAVDLLWQHGFIVRR